MREPGPSGKKADARKGATGRSADRPESLDARIIAEIREEITRQLRPFIEHRTAAVVINNHGGTLNTELSVARDTYQGNAGFVGPRAGDHATNAAVNQTQMQPFAEIDPQFLAADLRALRIAMMREAAANEDGDPDQALAIAPIAGAEKAAQTGDVEAAFRHLKAAGKWAVEIASKIGATVAEKAIEAAAGLS